ncbi:unnamed protein product [Trichobilharzia szidati]|nr:unnamed protein product [Trichobilharzia szidati]
MRFSCKLGNLTSASLNKLHRTTKTHSSKKCISCFLTFLLILVIYVFMVNKVLNFWGTEITLQENSLTSIEDTGESLSVLSSLRTHRITELEPHSVTTDHVHLTTTENLQHDEIKLYEKEFKTILNFESLKRPSVTLGDRNQNDDALKNLFPPLYPDSGFCLKKTRFYFGDRNESSNLMTRIINLTDALIPPLNMTIWSKIAPRVCQSIKTNLLIIVFSSNENIAVRQKIRQTWGSVKYIFSETTTNKQNSNGLKIIEHLFIVNMSKSNSPQNSAEFKQLIHEAEVEKDILPLFLTGIQHNYASLHILASEFLLHYCKKSVDFVLFINEDIFPNLNALIQYTSSKKLQLDALNYINLRIYCIPIEKKRMKAKPNIKFDDMNILAEWNGKIYPNHCDIEDSGFLMLYETMQKWYTCSRIYEPFHPVQVYLTGLLRFVAKIEYESYWTNYWTTGYLLPSMAFNKNNKRYLFFKGSVNQSSRVWKSVFRGILGQ